MNISDRVKVGDTIKLDTDKFDDLGVYNIISVRYRIDEQDKYTTAVDLVIEDVNGVVLKRTIASHQIIKL